VGNITVLGIGNILLSDEGLGVRAVEILRREFLIPPEVSLIDGGTLGLDLLFPIEDAEKLLVIDAVLGGKPPGSFHRLQGEEVFIHLRGRLSAHEIGFQEVLALLKLRGRSPSEIVVLGLEPADLRVGTELSPVLKKRIPLLIEECVKQLRVWGAKLERVRGCAKPAWV